MNLDKYEYYNTIDFLAGGDVLKHEAVKQLPVFEVILKLKYEAVKSLINKRRIEIMNEKIKAK